MYKHTKFFIKRQAESGIFYPICIIGPPLRPRRHPFAGNSPRRAVPTAGCPPPSVIPSRTCRTLFSFRPNDLPYPDVQTTTHPDEQGNLPPGRAPCLPQRAPSPSFSDNRGTFPSQTCVLPSLTSIPLPPGAANTRDKRAAAEQKAEAGKVPERKKRIKKGGVHTGTPPFTYPERAATTSHRYYRP